MNTIFKGEVLQWARTRARLSQSELAVKIFGKGTEADKAVEKVSTWERTGELTFHQAEMLAEKTHTPFGFLFLDEPPQEKLPINDFRSLKGLIDGKPSPDLLDVVYECQRRQAWFREYRISEGEKPLNFLGNNSRTKGVRTTASDISKKFKIGPALSTSVSSWEQNLSLHFAAVEEAGVLVMRSGVVGNNPHRPLSIDEFRGFALYDEYAPLVFVNSKDAKAAQLFTLAHELVHVWIGESAVSNFDRTYSDTVVIERFCNSVAAEILVPAEDVKARWNKALDAPVQIRRLAKEYKVSTLVMARRAKDLAYIDEREFGYFYEQEVREYFRREKRSKPKDGSGGDFHNTLRARASGAFCNALIASTLSGKTAYSDAFKLLGVRNTESFTSFARSKFPYLMK